MVGLVLLPAVPPVVDSAIIIAILDIYDFLDIVLFTKVGLIVIVEK